MGAVPIRTTSSGLESASLFYGNPESHIRRMVYSLFLQDDWRIRPRLTLNLGVRYELSSVIHDRDHILGSFDPNLGLVQEGNQIPSIYNPDHNNFAPRVGFAWDVRGDGKTVIRAGGSIIYELVILRTFAEVGNNPGLAGNQTAWVIGCSTAVVALGPNDTTNCPGALLTSGGTRDVGQVSWSRSDGTLGAIQWDGAANRTVYPASAIHNCSPAILIKDTPASAGRRGSRCPIVAVDRHLQTPYVETWTFSIQHALANNLVLDVAYLGNHGVKLLGRHEDNQPFAGQVWNTVTTGGLTFAQICNNTPTAANACNGQSSAFGAAVINAKQYINKFPHINTILRLANGMTSNYNGLQVSLTARNFHGFSTNLGYTYSKALDVNSSNGGNVGSDSYDLTLDYGRASSDLRHRLTLSPTYSFPSVQGYGGLLDGWKLNSIFKYQTGRPWQAGLQWGDPGGVGRNSRPDFFGDPKDFVVDYTGRNFAVFHPGGTTASGISPQRQAPYVAADLAINTPLCRDHARSLATLTANGCWTQGGSAITPAPASIFGSMTKGLFDGPSFWNLDMSVSKRQKVTERFSAEFRGEFFNIFNHPVFAQPSSGVTCSATTCNLGLTSNTPDVAATNPVLGSGGARRVQLGVKLLF